MSIRPKTKEKKIKERRKKKAEPTPSSPVSNPARAKTKGIERNKSKKIH